MTDHIDEFGKIYPEGFPKLEETRTNMLRISKQGGEYPYEIIMSADVDGRENAAEVRLTEFGDPIVMSDQFILARVDVRKSSGEEEQDWVLVDEVALLPRDEALLPSVLQQLVANPEIDEENQKGIRSKGLWVALGGTAVAVGVAGILIRRRIKKKNQ